MSIKQLCINVLIIPILFIGVRGITQTITVSPNLPSLDDEITVIYDITKGDAGLADCGCDIYIRTGLITSESNDSKDWKNTVTQWGVANADWKMTPVDGDSNKFSFTIGPSIRAYYNINPEQTPLKLAFVFRNSDATIAGFEADGSDILHDLEGTQIINSPADSLELVRFYNATDGPNWKTSWDLDQAVNTWFGVTVNAVGKVSELILTDNLLNGAMVDLQLSGLKNLHLSNNNLKGNLPDFSGMPNLTNLDLNHNNLDGTIPDFSNLPVLLSLSLEFNNLNGTIPDFSNLPVLNDLTLANNELSGTVPDFSKLVNLAFLQLAQNLLEGMIPDFSNLPNLFFLGLDNNNLVGSIPDFSNLPALSGLALSFNRITGNLPDFSQIPRLATLEVDNCRISGTLPDFSNTPNLRDLRLQNNDLEGPIPDFSNTPQLVNIQLSGNNLSGPLPDFSAIPNLATFFISDNNLEGNIPDFSNLPNLIQFHGGQNRFSGPIPDFSNLPKMSDLNLSENNLTGSLPDFSQIDGVQILRLHGNALGDTIPNFSNLPNLEILELHKNNFVYAPKMANLPFLNSFDVRINELTFDDIKRNLGLTNFFGELVNYRYSSQAPIPAVCDTIWAATGANLAFRLYFDEELTDNVYEWFRFGEPYLTTQGQNRLNIYDLEEEDTGDYSWKVTNPNVPGLELFVDNIFLQVDEINQDSLNHLRLSIPDVVGSLGETVCFSIQAEPFDSLSSLDLSMKWDPDVLAFSSVQDFNLTDLGVDNFDLSQNLTNQGRLTLSWNSVTNLDNGGENATETTSLYKLCFEAKADDCRNGLLEFTNDPLPLQVSNAQDSCVFFDGRPGTFIANCDQEFRIPDQSVYLAETEYTDIQGWTNYIKDRSAANMADTVLLSIKKNAREIGNVQDGRFSIEVQKKPNTIDITAQMRNIPGFEEVTRAIALDYWWYVQPNYTFVDADTTFGLGFYFEQEDLDRLSTAVGAVVRPEDLYFYKVSKQDEGNACLDLATAFAPGETRIYEQAATPSLNTWALQGFGETSLIGTMEIDGFSCGGIALIQQTVGIRDLTDIRKLSLSPNPSSGNLNLSFQLETRSNIQMKILNGLGTAVYEKTWLLQAGDYNEALSLEYLPTGMYFLQLQNEVGEVVSRKFILSR